MNFMENAGKVLQAVACTSVEHGNERLNANKRCEKGITSTEVLLM